MAYPANEIAFKMVAWFIQTVSNPCKRLIAVKMEQKKWNNCAAFEEADSYIGG